MFSVILMFSSCSNIMYESRIRVDYYSHFNKERIYATEANVVGFEYQPLGSLSLTMNVSMYYGYKPTSEGKFESNYYNGKKVDYEVVSIKDLYARVCQEVKSAGGDGIINLKINLQESLI